MELVDSRSTVYLFILKLAQYCTTDTSKCYNIKWIQNLICTIKFNFLQRETF